MITLELGVGVGFAGVWAGLAGFGAAGVGFADGVADGEGRAEGAGVAAGVERAPDAWASALLLKLFQLTQPVRATAAVAAASVVVFMFCGLLDDRGCADDLLDDNLGVEEGFTAARGGSSSCRCVLRLTRGADPGLTEGPGLGGILHGDLLPAIAEVAAGGPNDVLIGDLQGDFARAVGAVFDGGRGCSLHQGSQGGADLVAFGGQIAHGRVAGDFNTHDPLGELSVGIDLGSPLRHDLLLPLRAGEGGIALRVDVLLAGFLRLAGVGRDLDLAGRKLGMGDDGIEALNHVLNAHGADEFHPAIIEEFRLSDGHNAGQAGRDCPAHFVVLEGQVINRRIPVNLDAEDALHKQPVTIDLGGPHGFEPLPGARLLPDGRKGFGGGFFTRPDCCGCTRDKPERGKEGEGEEGIWSLLHEVRIITAADRTKSHFQRAVSTVG